MLAADGRYFPDEIRAVFTPDQTLVIDLSGHCYDVLAGLSTAAPERAAVQTLVDELERALDRRREEMTS